MESAGNRSLFEVHRLLEGRLPLNPRIYEAGGGSASTLSAALLSTAQITVVDIDATQLKHNRYATNKVLGDIQTYSFPSGSFDLIVCFNVIEHLDKPEEAIRLFYDSLSPGGLMFIGAPVRSSFSGWFTRISPHWFHVLYYRWVLKYQSAGKPGSVPFRTVFNPVVEPRVLLDFCRRLGCEVSYFREYRGMIYENMVQRRPLMGKVLLALVSLANLATFGRKDLRNGDFHLVVAKPAGYRDEQRQKSEGRSEVLCQN
jgi:SAM-dependent methyltransferase